jgi:hypothetical protein
MDSRDSRQLNLCNGRGDYSLSASVASPLFRRQLRCGQIHGVPGSLGKPLRLTVGSMVNCFRREHSQFSMGG